MKNVRNLLRTHELKNVRRLTVVGDRRETSAEHCFSAAILSRVFLPDGINGDRVMKMLLYHDLIEIEVGDVSFFDKEARKLKEKEEWIAFEKMKTEFPGKMGTDFAEFWEEYQKRETPDAKYAYACDRMDAAFLRYWNKDKFSDFGINKDQERKLIEDYAKPYPEMYEFAMKLFSEAEANGRFD